MSAFSKLSFIALAATLVGAPAHAAIEVDQVNLAAPGPYGIATGSIVPTTNPATSRTGTIQTVTAGKTGTLAELDLQIWAATEAFIPLPYSVSLYDGNLLTGGASLLGTYNYAASALPTEAAAFAGGLFSIDVSGLNYHVATGSVFSILLSVGNVTVGKSPRWGLGTFADDGGFNLVGGGLAYAGGSAAYVMGDGSKLPVGADRGFRTLVNVAAVPEPATWAMMIVGFGLVGAMARRRGLGAARA